MAAGRSSDSTEPKVPNPAAPIVDLLNSRPHATPLLPDTLDTPASAIAILRPFGQSHNRAPDPERLEAVRALRSDLVAIAGDGDDVEKERAWHNVTQCAAPLALRHAFLPPGRVQLEQIHGDPVLGGITLAVAELINAGVWPRIRVCANELCRHAFYDTTRSRTQRWHSYEICGNRTNVAAYRARNKKNKKARP